MKHRRRGGSVLAVSCWTGEWDQGCLSIVEEEEADSNVKQDRPQLREMPGIVAGSVPDRSAPCRARTYNPLIKSHFGRNVSNVHLCLTSLLVQHLRQFRFPRLSTVSMSVCRLGYRLATDG